MRSEKLFFNSALFKKQTQRFWPIWSLYTLLMVSIIPLYTIMDYSYNSHLEASEIAIQFQNYLIDFAVHAAPTISLITGLIIACAVWSYLHNSRSSALIHSLPMNRTSLFVTNYLTGICFFLVPNILVLLLTYGVGLSIGVGGMTGILTWFYCQTMSSLFFYSFATLLAFVTGNTLTLPVLYAIFNALVIVIYQMMNWVFGEFLYGYAWNSMSKMEQWAEYLTPVYAMYENLDYTHPIEGGMVTEIHGLGMMGIYALVGVVFTILGYLLYRRRKLELAGEVIAEPFLKPVFRVGFALCGGLAMASFFYAIFYSIFAGKFFSYMLFMLLWSAIFYIAGDMILAKSVKPRRKSLKPCAVLLVVLAVFGMLLQFDVFGYEGYTPEATEVENITITIDYNDKVIPLAFAPEGEKQEIILQVLALHEDIIAEKEHTLNTIKGNDPDMIAVQQENYANGWETWDWERVTIQYVLLNGKVVEREYQIPVTEALLENDSIGNSLNEFVNSPAVILLRHFPQADKIEYIESSIDLMNDNGIEESRWVQSFGKEASQKLMDALVEDMENGRIGIEYFLETEEKANINYENIIYIVTSGKYNTEEMSNLYKWNRWNEEEFTFHTEIRLQSTATATIEALHELGVEDEFLMTRAEYREMEQVLYGTYEKW